MSFNVLLKRRVVKNFSLVFFFLFINGCSVFTDTNDLYDTTHKTNHQILNTPFQNDSANVVDSMLYLAPELTPLMQSPEQLIDLLGFHHITEENLASLRAKEQAKVYRPKPDVRVDKVAIKGSQTQPDVNVYVINADQKTKRPVILYMHGGGYILGKASDSVVGLQNLAKQHDCVIVSVDYRLAPETPFPGALEDNYTALTWLYNNADKLGVDKNRIVIMGKSAGGGHAAMLAIAARDRGEVPIKHQILIYPMLDDRTGSTRKTPASIGQFLWTETSNKFGWSALLGQPAGIEHVPYGAVPARVENLTDLPPAFIQVGSIDLFVEENIDYAKRLIQAGVATELVVLPGMFHSAENVFRETKVAKRFKIVMNKAIEKALSK